MSNRINVGTIAGKSHGHPAGWLLLTIWVALFISACGSKEQSVAEERSQQSAKQSQQQTNVAAIEQPNFNQHIAPIIYENCAPCHRPGSAGPFSLTSYADVKKRAKMIQMVTASRLMPPWPADPNYRHFLDERILAESEIEMIGKWVKQGAIPGDTLSNKAQPPSFPAGSQLGKADLTLKIKPYPIKGDGKENFLLMKVPYDLPNDTYVRAVEFVPDQKQLVHHMNTNLVWYDPGKKSSVFEGEYVIPTDLKADALGVLQSMDMLNDDGSVPNRTPMICNYLPGVVNNLYPDGIGGFKMPKQGVLYLNDLHYGPSSRDTVDASYFNFFFTDKPPQRPTQEFILGTHALYGSAIDPPLVVPPDTVMRFKTEGVVPADISVLTINPHMHLLGKEFLAYAIPPSGDTIPLVHIPAWDFRWQYFYTFEKMLKIPAFSKIVVEGTYDNTTANPNNPHDPPQLVMERDGSMRSTDEMLQFIVTFLPYQAGDEEISLDSPQL